MAPLTELLDCLAAHPCEQQPCFGLVDTLAACRAPEYSDRVRTIFESVDRRMRDLREAIVRAQSVAPTAESISAELEARVALDQLARSDVTALPGAAELSADEQEQLWSLLPPLMLEVDVANTERMRELIANNGWFDRATWGEQVIRNAWLLVQHADRQVEFQAEVLALMEPHIADGQTEAQHYAYLYDRVAMNTGRPQRFGTQGRCTAETGWQPIPLEDPNRVDDLRREVGLESLAEYQARFADACRSSIQTSQ